MLINTTFLVDLIFNCALFGFKWALKNKKELLLEVFLQFGAITSTAIFYCTSSFKEQVYTINMLCIVLMLRYLRLLTYVAELTHFTKILETFKRFSTPFGHLLATMYTVMFFYIVIGMLLYSGKINT